MTNFTHVLRAESKHGTVTFDGHTVTVNTPDRRAAYMIGGVTDVGVTAPILWLRGRLSFTFGTQRIVVPFGRGESEPFAVIAVAMNDVLWG